MHIIFETERLYIRRYTNADEEHFFCLNSDAEVMRYIREPKSRAECNHFLLQNIASYEQYPLMGRWAMTDKQTGTFIGSFAIIHVDHPDYRHEIQLGYALLKPWWGKGYAVESTRAGLQYAFDVMKLPRIVAITEIPNIASQKVLLKCGFVQQPSIWQDNKELCYFTFHNPQVIETSRLHLFPLTPSQLELYLQANDQLETALNLARTGRTISPDVRERVTRITLPVMKALPGEHYLFHTFWLAVDKQTRSIVAELGFKGPPSGTGSVEIGYGTMPAMQRQGYMTEAIGGIVQWALAQPGITCVLAETHTSNVASIRVVQKNGFQQFERKGEMLWWMVNVKIS